MLQPALSRPFRRYVGADAYQSELAQTYLPCPSDQHRQRHPDQCVDEHKSRRNWLLLK